MNKHHLRNLARIILLIVVVLSSGCGQSTVIDSPMPTITNTIIIAPCVSSPRTPSLDIEKAAEEWFLASQPMIAGRNEYIPFDSWDGFCSRYQNAIINKEYWANTPIEIALNIISLPHPEDAFPTSIYA